MTSGTGDWERSSLELDSDRSHTPPPVPEKTRQVFQNGEITHTPQNQSEYGTGLKFDYEADYIDLDIFYEQELPIEKLFGEKKSNLRFYTFVWLRLFYFESARFNEKNAGIKERMLDDITQYFKILNTPKAIRSSKSVEHYDMLINDIVELFRSETPAQEQTLWIRNSNRSKSWIARKIKSLDNLSLYRLPNLTGYEQIQAIIDLWDYPTADKASTLETWKTQWRTNLKTDFKVKWLNETEHAKRRRLGFWNYVCEKHSDAFSVDHEPKSHDDVLEICDQLAEAGVDRSKIIKALQKLEREAGAESASKREQINVSLLPETIQHLSVLSEIFGLKRQYTVEKLINDTHASISGSAESFSDDAQRPSIPNGIPS
jgi:hypothetical protein